MYLRRVKNNKYQAPQLGDLGIRMRGPQYKQKLQSFTCDPCTKKKGDTNMRGVRETERERETWWCGTLTNFFTFQFFYNTSKP